MQLVAEQEETRRNRQQDQKKFNTCWCYL